MQRIFRVMIGITAVIAIVSISAFFYLTRSVTLPSTDVQSSIQQLDIAGSKTELVFRISQADSEASYTMKGILNGEETNVIGTTSEIAGDIIINLGDLTLSEVGEIRINARTFETDDPQDDAVARFILQSEPDENEFIVFAPTSISELPDGLVDGEAITSQVSGDLTIAGTTQSVSFGVTATLDSESTLSGTATATIQYADFGLRIPDAPFVASVADTVILTLKFVAYEVTGE